MSSHDLFFIYVAKNDVWQDRERDDWNYVHPMTRFYRWWINHYFNLDFNVQADILPVIPGKIFDRMSIGYLMRDHKDRSTRTFHFYLAYFKPFWTDCQTEGYSADNFGMVQWKRPIDPLSEDQRYKYYANINCPRVSHVLSHELIRAKGRKRKQYFDAVHALWARHLDQDLPYLYFNERFREVSNVSSYRYVTIDVKQIRSVL